MILFKYIYNAHFFLLFIYKNIFHVIICKLFLVFNQLKYNLQNSLKRRNPEIQIKNFLYILKISNFILFYFFIVIY